MPNSNNINPKKYLPKKDVLYNICIKPVFALPGKARATINAPPQSASSFKASVHAPNTFIMLVNLFGKWPPTKNKNNTSASNSAVVCTYLPKAINNPVIKRKTPVTYTSTLKCIVAAGGTGKITGLNPG